MNTEISIRLNGETRRVPASSGIGALVRSLDCAPQRLLIEHNGEPLPRHQWDTTALREGDRLELFQVSAGG